MGGILGGLGAGGGAEGGERGDIYEGRRGGEELIWMMEGGEGGGDMDQRRRCGRILCSITALEDIAFKQEISYGKA